MIYETDELPDPHVAMRTVRVMFNEREWNYQTTMNGKRKEICEYFRGAELNVSNHEETIRTPYRLEFIGEDETVAVILADAWSKAWGQYRELRDAAADANAWIQDIDGQTRSSMRKQILQQRADQFWSDNYRLLTSLCGTTAVGHRETLNQQR